MKAILRYYTLALLLFGATTYLVSCPQTALGSIHPAFSTTQSSTSSNTQWATHFANTQRTDIEIEETEEERSSLRRYKEIGAVATPLFYTTGHGHFRAVSTRADFTPHAPAESIHILLGVLRV